MLQSAIKDELLVFLDEVNRVALAMGREGNAGGAEAIQGYARAIVQTIQRAGIDLAGPIEPAVLLPILEESLRALTKLFAQSVASDELSREKATALARGQQLLAALRAPGA